MKRLIRGIAAVCATLAIGAVGQTYAADAATVAAATKEGEVVWYTTLVVDQAARPILEAFEKKYPGIKVRMSRSQGPETVAKVLAEVRAGRVDTDVIDATLSGVVGIPAEVMARLPAAVVSVVANNDRIPGDRWVPINQYFSCIAINTDMVKGADVPKSFEDLLDPKWKGKLVWHSTPDLSGPPGFIGMVLTTMGKDKGMAYLKRLADQKITILPTSQRGVMDQVISGAYPIQIMAVNHHAVISSKQGAPVTWLKINPLIGTRSYAGQIQKAPHPNAARLLTEFLMSEDGQNVLRAANYIPSHTKIAALEPTLKPDAGGFKAIVMTPAIAGKELPGWAKIFKDMFQ